MGGGRPTTSAIMAALMAVLALVSPSRAFDWPKEDDLRFGAECVADMQKVAADLHEPGEAIPFICRCTQETLETLYPTYAAWRAGEDNISTSLAVQLTSSPRVRAETACALKWADERTKKCLPTYVGEEEYIRELCEDEGGAEPSPTPADDGP